MIKIVLDTNVLVSAVLSPNGKPAQILTMVKTGDLQLIVSSEIIDEIKEVFLYPQIKKRNPFLQTPQQIEKFLGDLLKFAEVTPGECKVNVVSDASDNKFLECALEGEANFIISGDKHLKELRVFEGIEIVDPDEFLQKAAT